MLDPEKTGHAKVSALDAAWLSIEVFPVLQGIFGVL
jgi:hypothetical protein